MFEEEDGGEDECVIDYKYEVFQQRAEAEKQLHVVYWVRGGSD